MFYIYDFFSNLDVSVINFFTVIGALFSTFLSCFAIWLSIKINKKSSDVSNAIKKNTEALKEQSILIQNHTKILRLDNIRYLYELSDDNQVHNYWYFRWRFETYDQLRVRILESANGILTEVGNCVLLIQGYSKRADHVGFESSDSDFYKVKICEIVKHEGNVFPFAAGEYAACFFNQRAIISRGIDPWTAEPKYEFTIIGLGNLNIVAGNDNINSAVTFPRIKD